MPDPSDWHKWRQRLASRKPIALSPTKGQASGISPIVWGAEPWLDDRAVKWLSRLQGSLVKQKAPSGSADALQQWLSAALPAATPQAALESVAWARALPALAATLSGEVWCAAYDELCAATSSVAEPEQQPLVYQLLAVELAATLAHLFPELSAAEKLRASARQSSASLLALVLDDEGQPRAERLPILRPLWASWVRCRSLEGAGGARLFDDKQRTRLDKFFRQAVRLTRPDGSAVFARENGTLADPDLLRNTAEACHLPATRSVLQAVLRGDAAGVKGLPASAWYSEPHGLAILRTRWAPPYDQVTVRFAGSDLEIDIQSQGRPLVAGRWNWQATANNQPLTAAGPWEEVCWHSDADVDYLELELPLSGGWKLERQIVLGRKDRFLLVSEVLIGNEAHLSEPAELRFTSQLPLFDGVGLDGAKETREAYFTAKGKRLAAALPIALPEWRTEFCHADLKAEGGLLQQTAAASGKNLYLPLWLDLDARRAQRGLTWRRLTVGEELEIQPRDVAVGYRVQSGDTQWLVYRSLAGWGNRTVLGQNYSTEFVVCRFFAGGKSQDIIEIL